MKLNTCYARKWYNRKFVNTFARKSIHVTTASTAGCICVSFSRLQWIQKWCRTPDTTLPTDTSTSRIFAPCRRCSSTVLRSLAIRPASFNPPKISGFFLPSSKLESCETSDCWDYQLSWISIYRSIWSTLRNKRTWHDTIVRMKDPMSLNTQNSTRWTCQYMS